MDHASPDTPITEHLQKLASQGGASVKPPVFVSPQTIEQLTQIVHQKPNEHEITISTDPGLKSLLVICVRSLYSGDVFERVIDAAEVAELTSPQQLHTLEQLLKLMQEGIRAEAQVSTSPGAPVTCVSAAKQHADPNDKLYVFTFSISTFLASFDVVIKLPLKSAAALETRFDIKLARLEEEFGRQVDVLQQQLKLMQLQMNQRVFFGVNHSVHIHCTKLLMAEATGIGNVHKNNDAKLIHPGCHCPGNCGCGSGNRSTIATLFADVPSMASVKALLHEGPLFSTDTEHIMSLPSSALTPLQLCRDLVILSVTGPEITDLDFLANLPKLAEVIIEASQVRDLSPLATLPSLRVLHLIDLNLEGGGDVDVSCLAGSTTLTEVSFKGSSSVSDISPLASIPTLKQIDVTSCARVTDRRAFASNPGMKVVPELK